MHTAHTGVALPVTESVYVFYPAFCLPKLGLCGLLLVLLRGFTGCMCRLSRAVYVSASNCLLKA